MNSLIRKINSGMVLDFNEASGLFEAMVSGVMTDAQIAAALISMKDRGEGVDELAALAAVLNGHKKRLVLNAPESVDTCGTGGDGKSTVNISTAVSIILASMGYNVVKHGNRAQSGKVGSADILEDLGIEIAFSDSSPEDFFAEHNFVFMLAPLYHPALKDIGRIRREIMVPTIFNFVGPLVNPADPEYQVIGVNRLDRVPLIAEAVQHLGKKNVTIYASVDGFDEVSSNGKTECVTITGTGPRKFTIDPADFFRPFPMPVIESAHGAEAALLAGLSGKDENIARIFSLNTALALLTMGKAELADGFTDTYARIMDGRVMEKLSSMGYSAENKTEGAASAV